MPEGPSHVETPCPRRRQRSRLWQVCILQFRGGGQRVPSQSTSARRWHHVGAQAFSSRCSTAVARDHRYVMLVEEEEAADALRWQREAVPKRILRNLLRSFVWLKLNVSRAELCTCCPLALPSAGLEMFVGPCKAV
ncbi:hypothetical protein AGIG_G24324 [Arapaima gigas]